MFESTSKASLCPIDNREYMYDTLFRGELPYEPLPDDAQVGISGLSRITDRRGVRTEVLNNHLSRLPDLINYILIEHDLSAKKQGDEAIFAFVNDEARQTVSKIVCDVFTQWEVTHNRNNLPPLITEPSSNTKWLVIETAAAIMSSGTKDNNFNLSRASDKQQIAKLISSWGPSFIKQWFNGTIINQWLDDQHLTDIEKQEWRTIFSPSLRKYFAVHNISDPLKALDTVKQHLEVTLSDANIASRLSWSEAEVQDIFSPNLRRRFAVHNISDPLKALDTVKQHLEPEFRN